MNRADFGGAMFSDVSNELIVTTYVDDRTLNYLWKITSLNQEASS